MTPKVGRVLIGTFYWECEKCYRKPCRFCVLRKHPKQGADLMGQLLGYYCEWHLPRRYVKHAMLAAMSELP